MNEVKTAMNSSLKHMKFTDEMKERVLEEGRKAEGQKQNFYRRRAVWVAACLVLCVGTTVAAKTLLWDRFVAEKYNIAVDEQVQKETLEDGLASLINTVEESVANTTAEDMGIKIEVMQTVATNSRLDIYLKIQAENEEAAKLLVDTNPQYELSFENSEQSSGEASMENCYTGEGMKTVMTEGERREGPGYEVYSIQVNVSPDSTLNGDTVYLKIHNFVGNSQTSQDKVVEGDWELSWTIQASEKKSTFIFDKEYTIYGKAFKLNKIEMEPTSVYIYLDKELIDEQGLMGGEDCGEEYVYVTLKPGKSCNDSNLTSSDFESVEWRGPWGIPLDVYKDMTLADVNTVYDQIEAGTYEGEYIDGEEYLDEQHVMTGAWNIKAIRFADGTEFPVGNSADGAMWEEEDSYVIKANYFGYIDVHHVSEICLGGVGENCVISFADGKEE